jgi:hippurate hydrolase
MNDSNISEFGVSPELYQMIVELRRDLHRYPELSHKEERTAKRLSKQLKALSIPHRTGVSGAGVVADLPGRFSGPSVALRADTDALPILEETELPFASEQAGVMHACGHDGHSSMLVGAAAILAQGEPPPLPVRFIWQPAEEVGEGAQEMIRAGVLENVGMIFGGHLDRHYPAGTLIVTDGPVNASTDTFHIRIRGQQGHGARPHEACDAIVVASLMITALQTIVSREVDPAHPSVISVGSFHAGSAPNVIAGSAELQGTIRAQEKSVRTHLQSSISRMAQAIGQLHDARVSVEFKFGTPSVVNTPEMAEVARAAAVQVVGPERVVALHTANMGGEDFSYYLDQVPGCYIRFGGQVSDRKGFPAHSSQFDFDERALAAGAAWFAKVAHIAGDSLLNQQS